MFCAGRMKLPGCFSSVFTEGTSPCFCAQLLLLTQGWLRKGDQSKSRLSAYPARWQGCRSGKERWNEVIKKEVPKETKHSPAFRNHQKRRQGQIFPSMSWLVIIYKRFKVCRKLSHFWKLGRVSHWIGLPFSDRCRWTSYWRSWSEKFVSILRQVFSRKLAEVGHSVSLSSSATLLQSYFPIRSKDFKVGET